MYKHIYKTGIVLRKGSCQSRPHTLISWIGEFKLGSVRRAPQKKNPTSWYLELGCVRLEYKTRVPCFGPEITNPLSQREHIYAVRRGSESLSYNKYKATSKTKKNCRSRTPNPGE